MYNLKVYKFLTTPLVRLQDKDLQIKELKEENRNLKEKGKLC